jgi:hypothetical protein
MNRTPIVAAAVATLGLVFACSSSTGTSSGSSGSSGGSTSSSSSGGSSGGSSSTTSTSGSTSKFSCSINGDCYKCPTETAEGDCFKNGPASAGCTATDATFCQ